MTTFFNKNYNLPVCKFRGTKQDIKYPCFVSLKLDGELTYIIKKENKIFSVNKPKYGRYRFNYPALEEFKKLNLPNGIYLAELYWNEGRTKEDFYSLLRNKTSNNLKLAIFGILQQYDRIDFNAEETYNYLTWIDEDCKKHKFKYLSVIPQWKIYDEEELNLLMIEYIYKRNYEGLVVKRKEAIWRDGSSINWIKIKKKEREIEVKNKNGKVELKLNKYGVWL